jgi:hypothetical protein
MFAGSQSNASAYGKFDMGLMVELRDIYRKQLEAIIQSVAHPGEVNIEKIIHAWTLFLGTNVEPSPIGRKAAHELEVGFLKLNRTTQQAWACGFHTAMREYLPWSRRMLDFLDRIPKAHLRIPGVAEDVRDMIRPDPSWASLIT